MHIFILKRILASIPVIAVVLVFVFLLLHLSAGDPASAERFAAFEQGDRQYSGESVAGTGGIDRVDRAAGNVQRALAAVEHATAVVELEANDGDPRFA